MIERMKAQLRADLSEWLGSDIPDEGSEDHQTWVSRSQEIEDISTFEDVYAYLGMNEELARDIFSIIRHQGLQECNLKISTSFSVQDPSQQTSRRHQCRKGGPAWHPLLGSLENRENNILARLWNRPASTLFRVCIKSAAMVAAANLPPQARWPPRWGCGRKATKWATHDN